MAKPAYIYDGTQWVPIGPSLGPNSPVAYQTTAPTSPYTGQVWTDSDEGQKILRVWTGSAWALFDGYSTTTPSVTTYASGAYTLALADRDGIVNLTGGTNLVTNPSFEVDTSGWFGNAGATIARTTADKYSGTASCLVTQVATSYSGIMLTGSMPVTAGTTNTISAYIRGVTTSQPLMLNVHQLDSGGAIAAQSNSGNLTVTASQGWSRYSATFSAVASAVSVRPMVMTPGLATAGHQFYVDDWLFEQSSTLNPYFDNTYACVVTVPTNASAAFPVGTRTQLVNTSSGTVSVVGASGVTMTGVQTIASHQMMTLIKLGTDSWERISAVSSETGIHSFTSMGA